VSRDFVSGDYLMVVKKQKLIFAKWRNRIGPSVIVAEVDLEDTGFDDFNNSSYLPANETILRRVFQERHDIE
jgi:hypothetical protein